MNEPRRHHYIPQFYLAGFTSDGTKDGRLQVVDFSSGKQWQCKPEGVAHSRDYFRVDIPGQDPFVIERSFAQLEGEMATALKTVIESQAIPHGEVFSFLMHLVALSLSRVPTMRENTGRPIVQMAEMIWEMTVANPERYYSTLEDMKRDGRDVSGFPDYETAKKISMPDHVIVKPSQNWNVHSGLMMADIALELLPARNWTLVVPDRPEDIFISSDNPVSVSWTVSGLGRQPPGLGFKNTRVFMPLSSCLGLIGLFEVGDPLRYINSSQVAALNQLTLNRAKSQVYWRAEPSFHHASSKVSRAR